MESIRGVQSFQRGEEEKDIDEVTEVSDHYLVVNSNRLEGELFYYFSLGRLLYQMKQIRMNE